MPTDQATLRQHCAAIGAIAALTLAGCSQALSPEEEKSAARSAVLRWVQQHPAEWAIDLVSTKPLTRPDWSVGCDESPESGSTVLRHSTDDVEIDLIFTCPLGSEPDADDVAGAFSGVVLQELPHGIQSKGWRFRALTPSTAVTEGVTFDTSAPSELRIDVQTTLYAIAGNSTRARCQPPADGPYAEECYLLQEHQVPLRVSLTVPSLRE